MTQSVTEISFSRNHGVLLFLWVHVKTRTCGQLVAMFSGILAYLKSPRMVFRNRWRGGLPLSVIRRSCKVIRMGVRLFFLPTKQQQTVLGPCSEDHPKTGPSCESTAGNADLRTVFCAVCSRAARPSARASSRMRSERPAIPDASEERRCPPL